MIHRTKGVRAIPPAAALAILAHLLLALSLVPNGATGHQDEPYYLASTRTMLQQGDYILPRYNGEDRIKKPILFYWFAVAPQWISGPSIGAARLVSVVASTLLAVGVWWFSRCFFGAVRHRLMLLWGLLASDIFLRYAHYAVPEMTLTLFMSAAQMVLFEHFRRRELGLGDGGRRLLFFGLLGLGFMVKGPVAVLLPLAVAAIYLAVHRAWRTALSLLYLPGILLAAGLIVPWYLVLITRLGWWPFLDMVREETLARVVGHNAGVYYFLPISLAYYLPVTVCLIPALLRTARRLRTRSGMFLGLSTYPAIWFLTYFAWYSLVVGEKHQWYALQWCVPWLVIVIHLIRRHDRQGGLWVVGGMMRSLCFILAALTIMAAWILGPVLAPPEALAALVVLLLSAGAVITGMRMRRVSFASQFIVVCLVAMLGHAVVLHGVYPTTALRPIPRLAEQFRHATESTTVLVVERYIAKKFRAYPFPSNVMLHYESRPADYTQVWRETCPGFVVCRGHQWAAMAPTIRRHYGVRHAGYLIRRSFDQGPWAAVGEAIRRRDPGLLFDPLLLLERRGIAGPCSEGPTGG